MKKNVTQLLFYFLLIDTSIACSGGGYFSFSEMSLEAYYLFKASCKPVELKADETDEYGMLYKAGSIVVRGHFYDYVKGLKAGSVYKENSKSALINKDTIVFVGVDLEPHRSRLLLKASDHTELILSVLGYVYCVCSKPR